MFHFFFLRNECGEQADGTVSVYKHSLNNNNILQLIKNSAGRLLEVAKDTNGGLCKRYWRPM